jgi:hypothetical protein
VAVGEEGVVGPERAEGGGATAARARESAEGERYSVVGRGLEGDIQVKTRYFNAPLPERRLGGRGLGWGLARWGRKGGGGGGHGGGVPGRGAV